jgi:hypothetical protein
MWGESEALGRMASAIGSPQCGENAATKTASSPVNATPPNTVTHAARRGFGTIRSGTATDSANRMAPSSRPQNGAHATKLESSSPNADGTADRNRFDADRTTSASVSPRSCS